MIFTCPKCRELLTINDRSLVCVNNHSYDLAKEGYVHLLPVNKMHSKIPGDTKEMVSARRSFLEKGYYGLFSDELNRLVLKYTDDNAIVLDAGCGDGYYLRKIEDALKENNKSYELYGFDISKFAVKAAAKRQKSAGFAVSSIFDIPVKDKSVDLLVNIFAPMVESEFCRVLKDNGIMIYAVPTARHLYGLKELLYDEPYENTYKETDYSGFEFLERTTVTAVLNLSSNEDISNLFAMTPYYWKTPKEGCERLKNADSLATEIGFDFLVYRKADKNEQL